VGGAVVVADVCAGVVVDVIAEVVSPPVDVNELEADAEGSALLTSPLSNSCALTIATIRNKRENIRTSESIMSTDCDGSQRFWPPLDVYR
jgi:hypothetical protein